MKYNIKVNTVKSRNENNKVRGFACVVFEDCFKVDKLIVRKKISLAILIILQ